MDGFRDRFSRMDRAGSRGMGENDRYEREPERFDREPERYDRDQMRYERGYNDRGYGERDYADRRPSAPSFDPTQLEDIVNNSNSRQLKILQNYFEDTKSDIEASGKEVTKALDANNEKIEAILVKSANAGGDDLAIAKAKEEIMQAVLNNSEVLNMLKCSLVKDNTEEVAKEADDQELTRALVEELFSNLEDHVHKENVKCYRNVQAALESTDRGEAGQGGGNATLATIFSIIASALSLVNVAILVLYIFGIIG